MAAVYFIAWFLGGVRKWFLEKKKQKNSEHSLKRISEALPPKSF